MGYSYSSEEMRAIEEMRYGAESRSQQTEGNISEWEIEVGGDALEELEKSIREGDQRSEAAMARLDAVQIIANADSLKQFWKPPLGDPEIIREFYLAPVAPTEK